jgi:hypothetical protein
MIDLVVTIVLMTSSFDRLCPENMIRLQPMELNLATIDPSKSHSDCNRQVVNSFFEWFRQLGWTAFWEVFKGPLATSEAEILLPKCPSAPCHADHGQCSTLLQ